MSAQLELLAAPTLPERPRCRMCARPAWWLQRAQKWGLYCNSTNCSNRDRLCQSCGAQFTIGIDGAGTKYCSLSCRAARNSEGRVAVAEPCAWCGKLPPGGRGFAGQKWPYVCAECLHPIRYVVPRLKEHNVPHEMARRLLTNPGCEICGTDLLQRRNDSNGRVRPLLVVDHDHACCPGGSHSCGKCVRGLICRACNAAAGQLYDNADSARALAAYLDRWKGPPVPAEADHGQLAAGEGGKE